MGNHFKISWKKEKKPEYRSVPPSSNCKCPALMLGNIKGSFSDEDARVYYCVNPQCGKLFAVAPAAKFNDDEQARNYFKQIVSEIKLPTLDRK